MRLCAIIIVFKPDYSELKRNICSIYNGVDTIVLWQNSAINTEDYIFNEIALSAKDKLKILGTGENVGIGAALNNSIRWAIQMDFTHILTLDQDSSFYSNHLLLYKSKVQLHEIDSIGIFGVNPFYNGKMVYSQNNDILYVNDCITSGSIFPIKIFKLYGFFNEKLFIDAVDYEYCYRLKKQFNISTVVFPEIILLHKIGYIEKTKFGFKIDNYSAFRTYHIVRNQLYMWRLYPTLFSLGHKYVLVRNHIVLRSIKIALAENHKWLKIKSLSKGIVDGLMRSVSKIL